MRVDLDELERKQASSVDRGGGVAVVNEEDFASLIAELRAARKLIDSGRTGATVCRDVACNCEQSELWREYLAATKGDA